MDRNQEVEIIRLRSLAFGRNSPDNPKIPAGLADNTDSLGMLWTRNLALDCALIVGRRNHPLSHHGKLPGMFRQRNGLEPMKAILRKVFLALAIMLALPVPADAGPVEDALTAAKRGDYATALRLWRPLAEQGDAVAEYFLGFMYREGYGVPQDYAEAVKWFRMAAEQGIADAQNNLGDFYKEGWGVRQDDAEAAKWYRKAAEQGNVNAQAILGAMYHKGRGVPQDYAEAFKWHRKAAEQGDAEAQLLVGFMYAYDGQGVPQDYAESVKWYRMAAEQGNAQGQFNLAAAQGNAGAQENRDIAAKRMTPDQIAEAQRMAREWLAKHQ